MDTVDSRTLGYFDCYFRQFPSPGEVRFSIAGADLHPAPEDAPFTITVGGTPGREPKQHDVTVGVRGGRLEPDRARLSIAPGDHVMLHAEDVQTPRYSVRGSGPDGAWSSSSLDDDSMFSHTFGLPGEYHLVDAVGGRVVAVVVVKNPPAERDPNDHGAWRAAIQQPAVVAVEGRAFRTQKAEIVVGQTAIFMATGVPAPGITVTEQALLLPAAGEEGRG